MIQFKPRRQSGSECGDVLPLTVGRLGTSRGRHASTRAIESGEVIETAEEMPRLSSMRKKRILHSWGAGKLEKATGNTSNAREVPPTTTSSTGTPRKCDRWPRYAKTVKPQRISYAELVQHTIMALRTIGVSLGVYEA